MKTMTTSKSAMNDIEELRSDFLSAIKHVVSHTH